MQFNNPVALQRAKKNVDELYAAVIVLEELEKSFLVLEKKLPKFFLGIMRFDKGKVIQTANVFVFLPVCTFFLFHRKHN